MNSKRWQKLCFLWVLMSFMIVLVAVIFQDEHVIIASFEDLKQPQRPLQINRHRLKEISLPVDKIVALSAEKEAATDKIIKELESMLADEKAQYNMVFNEYKKSIIEYENLSADFDSMVREQVRTQELGHELYEQAQEVRKLEKQANTAYKNLMAKYDEVVPAILAKYF